MIYKTHSANGYRKNSGLNFQPGKCHSNTYRLYTCAGINPFGMEFVTEESKGHARLADLETRSCQCKILYKKFTKCLDETKDNGKHKCKDRILHLPPV